MAQALETGALKAQQREQVNQADLLEVTPTPPAESALPRVDLLWLSRSLVSRASARGRLTGREVDSLERMLEKDGSPQMHMALVARVFSGLKLRPPRWRTEPSTIDLPALAFSPVTGFQLIYGKAADDAWLVEENAGLLRIGEWPEGTVFTSAHAQDEVPESETAIALFNSVFWKDRSWLYQAGLASLTASILALATSLYSMQVYDRVISTGGIPTLIVLSIGVFISTIIELFAKSARSVIIDRAVTGIDTKFALGVFDRMLKVRLDQMPPAVGTFAAQVRGFETVRGFKVASTLYMVTDAPFALFFLFVIFLLGGPLMAAVPAVALSIAVIVGFMFRRAVQEHSRQETLVGNRRQGLLVETIHGAETLKGLGSGWRMFGRWNELSRQTIGETMQVKKLNDQAGFLSAWIQQVSYVSLVAMGAYLATSGSDLTIGSIIACSIVSGRVLTPINMLPGLMSQWGHARVALSNLENLFALERDNHACESPLVPESLSGKFTLKDVEYSYSPTQLALAVKQLSIEPGERVAILGSTGAGKSTLLKLLAGVFKAERGQVLLDGLDIQQVAADRRAELVGYLPQHNKLFSGTLRENLLLGLPSVDDARILEMAERTGLSSLIGSRPEGLNLRIAEGGAGLSGGQAQLVAITRLLLASPSVWLMDEPTASLDDVTEEKSLAALREHVGKKQTLVVVTHKMKLLELVDRVIVLTPQGVALDGPRDGVLERLRRPANAEGKPARPSVVVAKKGSAATAPAAGDAGGKRV